MSTQSRTTGQLPVIVAGELRERLIANEWLPGGRLPSETELAAHYGVSRATIRGALKRLEEASLIRTHHGRGSFVTDLLPDIETGLHELRSMSATIANAGHEPGIVYRKRELRMPTGVEMQRLQISRTTPVLALERSILSDGKVVAFDYDVINGALLPADFDPESLEGSFFNYLQRVGLEPERAIAAVRPVLSKSVGWGRDRSPEGLYLLLDQVQYLHDDRILSWSLIYFIEDRFQFTILRKRTASAPTATTARQHTARSRDRSRDKSGTRE